MTTCQTSLLVPLLVPLLVSLLVSLLAKSQELPVFQLARHVDLLHLVIADNRRPETLSLPHGFAPPIKPIPIPAKLLLPDLGVRGTAHQSVINLSFPHVAWGLYSAVPYNSHTNGWNWRTSS
jgi:hypothetical protein